MIPPAPRRSLSTLDSPAGEKPTLFFLHALGSSALAAEPLAAELGELIDVVGIDLPGFGSAPPSRGLDVRAMADHAIERIAALSPARWLVAGHSMGGKVASVVAARALGGEEHVFGLMGLVLLAASPPTPEPMSDDKRAEILGWTDRGSLTDADARTFVAGNVARALDPAAEATAVADLRRASRAAWRHWLTDGSREDVSNLVGALDLPALVLAGEDDADLGAAAQPGLQGAFLPRARFEALPETGHLLPFERPAEVAAAITRFWRELVAPAPSVPAPWARLIASSRTDASVRRTLARRALPDDPERSPFALGAEDLKTLGALADLVVPQPGEGRIDLAGRVDAQLARGEGDGWRPADLPPDVEAYRAGLAALRRAWAETSDPAGVLERIAAGALEPAGGFSAAQLRAWFEDARVDLVRQWLAHPASMARVGYDGFATGGTVVPLRGFGTLSAGTRDDWEPADVGGEPASASGRSVLA